MFKVPGQWVSPIEIESTLVEHASMLEAAVIAFEEESRLHTAKVFAVLRADCTLGCGGQPCATPQAMRCD
jgi:acyl-coenzyme A synthetase/AMP-(fatty) acid ligase